MKKLAFLALVAVPGLAFGGGGAHGGSHGGGGLHGGGGFQPGGGVHFGGGGLGIHYGHSTGPSSFSLGFRSGFSRYGGYSFYGGPYSYSYYSSAYPFYGAYPGGAFVYGSGYPYTTYSYSGAYGVPYSAGSGAVLYTTPGAYVSTPGAQVYGTPAGGQAAAGAPAVSPQALSRLPVERIVDQGDTFFGRGQYLAAVEAYRIALQKDPKNPLALIALADGLFAVGSYAESAAVLRSALQLYPELARVRMNRRDFYGQPADFDVQLARLVAFVRANPNDRAARLLLGYNCFFTQQYAAAKEQFDALGPQDKEAQLFVREIAQLK